MELLETTFKDRLQEIDTYLDLLQVIEQQIQTGPPVIGNQPITAQQQKILYSSVYVQLYNLVEATATCCLKGVAAAVAEDQRWRPSDLSKGVLREWVRASARTHTNLAMEKRLQTTLELVELLVEAKPVQQWSVELGSGGNWDDTVLEAVASRLGCQLKVSKETYQRIKQKVRDDKSPLVLIKDLRNRLAHGSLSFSECGENVSVAELREIRERAAAYLGEVVSHFQAFINNHGYLLETARPAGGAPA